ncbi:Ig-like domain-containing protein, partial [Streptococcus suis]|uniref:Ig-like domain-containing protein n=1 Tax=Streptococcus suis TaxID=1307 RepID=UPI001EE13BC8
MYFNRKNSQQKNWRMIKKGKHFLFGCALVFAIGASANIASAETIITEATTVDQAQDSTAVSEEADSEAATSTAVSEVASSTSATSEVASETVATSTVATSENSELASTTSEAVTSENSESASAASSEAASSETASSTTVEAASEVSATVSASETAVANRTAYIGYEVQYTTSSGEVVGKTANIVATDTTEAVATSTLTVAATDVPAGYELAAEQAYSLTQQISENQINILSFAVVKKSEEEEIAESQLANKTVLEQVISEAIVLSDEALRQVATTQAGNTELEAAATSTQATVDQANLVLADATATQEQVDSQVETVKASTLALADEMLKVDEDGNLTVALNTEGTSVSSTRGSGDAANVVSNYEIRDGYVYWTHEFNNNYVNMNYYNYFFTIPSSVGAMEDLVVTQYNRDGSVRSTSNTWPDGEGDEGGIAANIGRIGNGYFDKKSLNGDRVNAPAYKNQNHILSAIDRTGFAGSDAILNNSQAEYYVLNSSRRTNNTTRWTVTYRTPIVDDSKPLDYIAGGAAQLKSDNNDVVVGTYGAVLKEDLNIQNDYKLAWTQQSVSSRNDAGFTWSDDGKSIIYYYDADDTTSFNGNEILKLLVANPVDSTNRTLNGDEKEKLETGIVNSTADNYYGTGDSTGADGFYYKDYLAYENGNLVQYLDLVNPTHLGGGETIPLDVDKTNTTDSITIDAKNGAGEITITSDDIPSGKQLVNSVTQRQVYAGTRIVALDSTINSATDTNVVNLYFVPYTAAPNQAPTIDSIGTDGTQLKTTQATNKYLFVFGTTEGTTETETGATTAAPVANKDNATATIAMSDADGTIVSVSYDDANTPMTTLGSNLTLGTDGKLEGSFAHAAGGSYTRRVIVTDDDGATATSNSFYTFAYTDKEVDTTSIEKEEGTAVTEDEIFAKLAIATTSDAFPNTGNNVPTVPDTEYTRTVVGYRAVGSADVTKATVDTLPTTGEYEVRVQTRNIYGQDIYNWVTVKFTDTTAPETPSVVANEDGTVTVTPSQTAGDDTKTTDITYTDETGTSQTVTVTKEDDGTWTVPADSGVTVDPTTGAVTIPADKVQDGSTVSATSTDEAGNTSNPATDTAKNNPDKTAPAAPAIETDLTGKAGTTDPIKVTGAEPGSTVTLKDPAGNVIGTGTANDNGEVEITPTTPLPEGQVTATSTDEAGNESEASEPKVATTPDTTAPEAPTIETDLTGKAGTTDPVTVTGAEPGSTVTLKDKDGNVIGTGPADENGVATITPATPLPEGQVTATSTDEAGNESEASEPKVATTPDTTAPEAPTIETDLTGKAGTTDPVTVTGAEPGSTVTLKDKDGNVIGTGTADENGVATITPTTPLPEGQVTATSTDEAGNESEASEPKVATTPDTTAPEAPVVNAPKEGDTTVTGTTEPGATVTVTFPDGSTVTTTADENGNYTVDVPAGVELKEGDKVTATATDEAGNTS